MLAIHRRQAHEKYVCTITRTRFACPVMSRCSCPSVEPPKIAVAVASALRWFAPCHCSASPCLRGCTHECFVPISVGVARALALPTSALDAAQVRVSVLRGPRFDPFAEMLKLREGYARRALARRFLLVSGYCTGFLV